VSNAVQGIVDKRTNRFYEMNFETLIHLGATNSQFFEFDKINENPCKEIKILGTPAPALFLYNLKKFEEMNQADKIREVQQHSLSYTLLLGENCENLLHYLCKADDCAPLS